MGFEEDILAGSPPPMTSVERMRAREQREKAERLVLQRKYEAEARAELIKWLEAVGLGADDSAYEIQMEAKELRSGSPKHGFQFAGFAINLAWVIEGRKYRGTYSSAPCGYMDPSVYSLKCEVEIAGPSSGSEWEGADDRRSLTHALRHEQDNLKER